MGFLGNVSNRIRDFFRNDKSQVAAQIAKGATAAAYPTNSYDILQSYGYDVLQDSLRLENDLLSKYVDYEEMGETPLIASALDIYADDASQTDSARNRTIWVTSQDQTIADLLGHDLFHKTLRMDEEIWEIARTMVSMGNDYEELLVTQDGVKGLNFLAPPTVRRIEGPRGELHGFIQDYKGRFGYSSAEFQQIMAARTASIRGGPDKVGTAGSERITALEDWEVVHFRLRSKHRRAVYGSCLAGDSLVWTAAGAKPIKDVKKGDLVFTRHAGRLLLTEVLDQVCSGEKQTYTLRTKHRTLNLTAEHPVLIDRGGKNNVWKPVSEVKLGEKLVLAAKAPATQSPPALAEDAEFFSEAVESIDPRKVEPVYDIEVAGGSHNFIADGAVVHNSALESARWIWKRLMLLEDSALRFRLERAPERYAFYVDVGDLPPNEAMAYLNRVRQQHRKKRWVNPSTGKMDLRFDPMSNDEDFVIPTRQGADGTRIEVLGSPSWQCLTGDTEVLLSDYSRVPIRELAARGGSFEVLSANSDGLVVKGHAHSARISHESAEIWAVALSTGDVVRCTHNHPFLMVDGSWVWARDLREGALLLSLSAKTVSVAGVTNTREREPVYDLTVDEHHNFAIGQGVIVHNSVEDLNYFRDMLFAAIKVPRSYFSQEDGANKNTLSAGDVRFARTILRVQRELKNGLGKIARVHLAALNIDPEAVDYDIHMMVPSSIFELAQLEVKNARADLAGRMQGFVSMHWILSTVFGLSDDEIKVIFKEKEEDAARDANLQANTQSVIQRAVAQAGMEGQAAGQVASQDMMAQLAPPGDPNAPAAPAAAGQPAPQEGITGAPAIHIKGARPIKRLYGLEQKLFEGHNKAFENEARDKLNTIMRTDRRAAGQLKELGAMLRELNHAVKGIKR